MSGQLSIAAIDSLLREASVKAGPGTITFPDGAVGKYFTLLFKHFPAIWAAALKADALAEKVEGLEADLFLAVSTAYNRGAVEWTRLNYPEWYQRLGVAPPNLSAEPTVQQAWSGGQQCEALSGANTKPNPMNTEEGR